MGYQAIYIASSIFPLNSGSAIGTFSTYKRITEVISTQIFSLIDNEKFAEAHKFAEKNDVRFFINQSRHNFDYYLKRLKVSYPVNEKMLTAIIEELKRGDYKFIFYDFGTREYLFLIAAMFPNVKKIYISNNAEYLNIDSMLKETSKYKNKLIYNSIINKLRAYLYKNDERKCCQLADLILSVSIQDSINLSREFGIDQNKFVFCKPFIEFNRVKEKDDILRFQKKLLIVGSMSWPFNVDGVLWFVKNVFDRLIELDSDYILYLVGRDPSPEIVYLAEKYKGHIVVTGTVGDIDEYYRMCDICIIPVFTGTGVKIKLLEALGKGIPTICHTFSAMGYNGVENAVVIADSPNEYIDAILRLQKSIEARNQLHSRMIEYYQDYMSDDSVLQNALNALVNS